MYIRYWWLLKKIQTNKRHKNNREDIQDGRQESHVDAYLGLRSRITPEH